GHALDLLLQNLGAALKGAAELLLFSAQRLADHFAAVGEFGVVTTEKINNCLRDLVKENSINTKRPGTFQNSPSYEPSENVSPSCIARKNAVRNAKSSRACMVSNYPECPY